MGAVFLVLGIAVGGTVLSALPVNPNVAEHFAGHGHRDVADVKAPGLGAEAKRQQRQDERINRHQHNVDQHRNNHAGNMRKAEGDGLDLAHKKDAGEEEHHDKDDHHDGKEEHHDAKDGVEAVQHEKVAQHHQAAAADDKFRGVACPGYDKTIEDLQIPLKHLPRKKKTSVAQKYDRRANNCGGDGIWNKVRKVDHHQILNNAVALAGIQNGAFVLDWGSGCGHKMEFLQKEHGITGVGIDVSNLTVQWAVENTSPKNRFCVADGTRLEFIPTGAFDHGFSFGSIYHVYNRSMFCHVLRQLVRTTRVGGTVYNGWTENGEFHRTHYDMCLGDLPVSYKIVEEKDAFSNVKIFPLKAQQFTPNTYSLIITKKAELPAAKRHLYTLEYVPISCGVHKCEKRQLSPPRHGAAVEEHHVEDDAAAKAVAHKLADDDDHAAENVAKIVNDAVEKAAAHLADDADHVVDEKKVKLAQKQAAAHDDEQEKPADADEHVAETTKKVLKKKKAKKTAAPPADDSSAEEEVVVKKKKAKKVAKKVTAAPEEAKDEAEADDDAPKKKRTRKAAKAVAKKSKKNDDADEKPADAAEAE
jgi:ubiquinone/menaquinone biosynthesis C-methylase UbiE